MKIDPAATRDVASAARAGQDVEGVRRQALELAHMFESTLLAELLRQMRTPVGGEDEGLLGGSGGPLGDTLDVEFAQALSRAGGLGLADALAGTLERQLHLANAPGRSAGAVPAGDPSLAVAAPSTGLPLPAGVPVSSGFGWRTDPFTKQQRFHRGVDLAAGHGEEVAAVADGRVASAGWQGGYGLTVLVEHPDGLTTRYAHLSRIEAAAGQEISAGQTLGRVGQSGRATGPHLHFEVAQDGRPIDPRQAAARFAAALKVSSGGVDFPIGPTGPRPVEGEQHED